MVRRGVIIKCIYSQKPIFQSGHVLRLYSQIIWYMEAKIESSKLVGKASHRFVSIVDMDQPIIPDGHLCGYSFYVVGLWTWFAPLWIAILMGPLQTQYI